MFCKKCGNLMKYVMSFTGEKAYEFNRCPVCFEESKHIPLIFKDNSAKHEGNGKTVGKEKPNKPARKKPAPKQNMSKGKKKKQKRKGRKKYVRPS